MRGGAQSHLMRCDDGGYYVVKFQENPQHTRVLVNELLGSRLAARLGLPVPPSAVIDVAEELIRQTPALAFELGRGRKPCPPGRQYGSRYPEDPATLAVYDLLPDEELRAAANLEDFLGIFVFDKWTCNTNGRQAIFYRTGGSGRYRAMMVDQGFCFNAGEWNFPDAPLRGLYMRAMVYESVAGLESFGPWLERIERRIGEETLDGTAAEIPPEWYDYDQDSLFRLLEQLLERRNRLPRLIEEARDSYRNPFPNWRRN